MNLPSFDVEEFINRRRRQILVHSYLYYRVNTNVIDDYTFDLWSKQLADIQKQYPQIADKCVYADAFKNFDGSSGYDLPLGDPNVVNAGEKLLRSIRYLKERGLA